MRESREDEEERSSTSATATGDAEDEILVLQDLFSAGYQPAAQDRADESGLDFNHRLDFLLTKSTHPVTLYQLELPEVATHSLLQIRGASTAVHFLSIHYPKRTFGAYDTSSK